MATAIDLMSKGLTILVLLLAAVFVVWQLLEGLFKITTIGRGFLHYCVNRHNFERWLKEMDRQEAERRSQAAKEG